MAKRIADCDKKLVFPKRGNAMIYSHKYGHKCVPYRCDVCGHWHLTSG